MGCALKAEEAEILLFLAVPVIFFRMFSFPSHKFFSLSGLHL